MSKLVSKSLDLPADSFRIFAAFRNEPHLFFLDSSASSHGEPGRYSFIGFDPFFVYRASDGAEALDGLKKEFARIENLPATSLTPLPAGAVGFLSYDAGLGWENISGRSSSGALVPQALFGFYDVILTIDHRKKKLHIVSTGLPERGALRKKRARQRLDDVLQKLHRGLLSPVLKNKQGGVTAKPALKSNFRKEKYYEAVRKVLAYIREGDVYQVNLSQRFSLAPHKKRPDPVELYSSLRKLTPSHFTGYFAAKDFQVLSSSPERFLHMHGRTVQTRPMKGTRPRGDGRLDDRRQKQDLLKSRKDKAELLMVTDLERNDLGRVCEFGSVKVKRLRGIEPYRTVYQATSIVEGILRRDKDVFDLLRACFPGGSITGCPKIRAMQIISELEPHPRGLYTGILGYLSFSGDMDFNILIRTMLVHRRGIFFHVGGGIVADSTPEGEYKETLVKAKAMCACLEEVLAS